MSFTKSPPAASAPPPPPPPPPPAQRARPMTAAQINPVATTVGKNGMPPQKLFFQSLQPPPPPPPPYHHHYRQYQQQQQQHRLLQECHAAPVATAVDASCGGGAPAFIGASVQRGQQEGVFVQLGQRQRRQQQQRQGTEESPFIQAAVDGDLSAVEACLPNGIVINTSSKTPKGGRFGSTALGKAAGNGHIPIVKILLVKGADVNARRNDDESALHVAAINGYDGVVSILLENAANKDGGVASPVMASDAEGEDDPNLSWLRGWKVPKKGGEDLVWSKGSSRLLEVGVGGGHGNKEPLDVATSPLDLEMEGLFRSVVSFLRRPVQG
eukprot:g13178.t1